VARSAEFDPDQSLHDDAKAVHFAVLEAVTRFLFSRESSSEAKEGSAVIENLVRLLSDRTIARRGKFCLSLCLFQSLLPFALPKRWRFVEFAIVSPGRSRHRQANQIRPINLPLLICPYWCCGTRWERVRVGAEAFAASGSLGVAQCESLQHWQVSIIAASFSLVRDKQTDRGEFS